MSGADARTSLTSAGPPAASPANLVYGVEVPYRARFDECTPAGTVRTSTFLRFAQDIAGVHSDALGFDRAWYAQRGLAWVVRSVELEVLRPIVLGDVLKVRTAVTGFRKVWARRRGEMRTPDGDLAAWAHTDWVMTDARGMPTRVPDEFPAAFSVPPGGFDPVKVGLPAMPPGAAGSTFTVRPQELDPMAHVNNAVYLDYFEEAVLREGGDAAVSAVPRRYRLEYILPAALSARLTAGAWRMPTGDGAKAIARPDAWAWLLAGTDGRTLARGRLDPGA
jgi:acyl-CoA thioesterase FadM